MKLSKNLGRIATTFLATAMLASVSAVPAFAEPGVGDNTGAPKTTDTVTIYKDITKPNNVYLPNATFTFDIDPFNYDGDDEPAWADAAEIDSENNSIVSAPKAALVTDTDKLPEGYSTVEIAEDATGTDHTVRLADSLEIDLTAADFGDPGEYEFLITENGATYETDLTYADQYMVLKVIVSRGTTTDTENTLYIAGYVLYKASMVENKIVVDTDSKFDAFENNYATDGDNNDQTVDFDLTKQVTGNGATSADEKKHFEFTIKIENNYTTGNAKKEYAVTMSHAGNCTATDRQDITSITEDAEVTFKLAEGDTFHIDGLTANDKITVTEPEDAAYTTSYKTVVGKDTSFENAQSTKNNVATIDYASMQSLNDQKTEFTNEKTVANPTGIVMDVAPYVLLVVVAAAGCFVFLRKRRED